MILNGDFKSCTVSGKNRICLESNQYVKRSNTIIDHKAHDARAHARDFARNIGETRSDYLIWSSKHYISNYYVFL